MTIHSGCMGQALSYEPSLRTAAGLTHDEWRRSGARCVDLRRKGDLMFIPASELPWKAH